jgi:FlaA1/EpsC-like NDP-sugar epimerase
VFDSARSVVRVFHRQIAAGGPVTVNDPEITRFVMPTEQAVELVMDAARASAAFLRGNSSGLAATAQMVSIARGGP